MPAIGRPAKEFVNSPGCTDSTQNASGTCVYEDQLFENRVHRVLRGRPVQHYCDLGSFSSSLLRLKLE